MSYLPGGTICAVSNPAAAAVQLGGKFDREDCGWFSKCEHPVEKYDTTIAGGGYVEIWYCEIDWLKTAPLMVAVFVVMVLFYRRLKNSGWRRNSDEGGGSSHRSGRSSRHYR